LSLPGCKTLDTQNTSLSVDLSEDDLDNHKDGHNYEAETGHLLA